MFGDLFHELHQKAHICILKHSNDAARRRDELLTCEGRENGPDCVFRFIPTVGTINNPAYSGKTQKAFSELQIGKFYNVKPSMGRRIHKHNMSKVSVALEEFHDQLETDIIRLFRESVPNQRILLMAANNDVLHPCIRTILHGNERVKMEVMEKITGGFLTLLPPENDRKLKVVIFSNMLDVRPMYEGFKIHSGCSLRKYVLDFPQDSIDILYFGVDKNMVTDEELDFCKSIQSDKVKITIKYHEDIQSSSVPLLDQMKATISSDSEHSDIPILLLFNVEVLNVVFAYIVCLFLWPLKVKP